MKNHRNFILLGGISLVLVIAFLLRPHPESGFQVPHLPEKQVRNPAPAVLAPVVEANEVKESAVQELQTELPKIAAFDDWVNRWNLADAAGREALAAEGARLATERRPEFKALIAANPQLALERSVPRIVRQDLPAGIVAQLETPVSAKGEFMVKITCNHCGENPADLGDHGAGLDSTERFFDVGATSYKAHVVDELEGLTWRKNAPLQGVAMDDELAVAANAVRPIESGERIPAGVVVETLSTVSSIATADVSADSSVVVEIAGRLISVASNSELVALENDFSQWALHEYSGSGSASFFNVNFPNPAAKKIGNYKVLYVRVNYPESLSSMESKEVAEDRMREFARIYHEWSYGKMVVSATITPTVTLPWAKACGNDAWSYARAAARKLGYDLTQYDTFILQGVGFGGVAFGDTAIVSQNLHSTLHEVGHRIGAWHAGFWPAMDGTGYGFPMADSGTEWTYGNSFDVMGDYGIDDDRAHFNMMNKLMLGWLSPGDVYRTQTSGAYRIHAFDQPRLEQGKRYGLVATKDSNRNYYLEYRTSLGSQIEDTALVLVGNEKAEARLVDTTPYSLSFGRGNPGKRNSGIAVGRTFSDLEGDMHFTVVSKNATTPASLDIVYNRGPFPGNQAPTLAEITPSATSVAVGGRITFDATAAVDADGDALAYFWDFDDGVSASNSPVVSRTFTAAAQITAMLTVSDMKGGTVRRHVVVNVGDHGKQTITGNITLNGQPVANAYITVTGGKYAFTDHSGNYAFANLSTGSVTLTAKFNGYALTPSFSNPLTVIAGTNLANWTAAATSTFVTLAQIADANEGGANGTFRFTRTGSTAAAQLVRVANPSGSATMTTDYTFSPSRVVDSNDSNYWTFTIPAGQAALDVSVVAVDDTLAEGPETIRLNLVHNGTYLLSEASVAAMTLNDNDTTLPQVSVVSNDPYATEFPADPGSFTITRIGSTAADLNVSLAWSGTATNGTDFTTLPAVVTIPAGQISVTMTVAPLNDDVIEGIETPIATIQASAAAYVIDSSSASASVELADDDIPVVTVSVPDASASESGSDGGIFLIRRTGSTAGPLKVYYGVSGTALHGTDYNALSGEVNIPAGASSAPVTITPYDDNTSESLETVVFAIATVGTTYTVGAESKGTVTIADNEGRPLINVRPNANCSEGSSNASVVFHSSGSSSSSGNGSVTVHYTVSGTATSGKDFTALSGTITMPVSGINEVTLNIPIADDAEAEPTENVVITLVPDSAYLIEGDSTTQALILDNDSGGQRVNAAAADIASPAESDSVSGGFYITRTDSTADLVVNYGLSGTATNGIDYVYLPGTVTISAGQSKVLVNLIPIDDTQAEGLETVTLTVLPGNGYSPESFGVNTLEIADNEVMATTVGFQLAQTLTSRVPGTNGEFRDIEVRLSAASLSPVTAQVVAGSGTSAQGDNVEWAFIDADNNNALIPTAALTFQPGVTSRNVRIRIKSDRLIGKIGTVNLQLTSALGASLSSALSSHEVFIFDAAVPAVSPLIKEDFYSSDFVYINGTWDTVTPTSTSIITSGP